MRIENLGCFHLMQGKGSPNIEITNLTRLNDVPIIPRPPLATSKIDLDPKQKISLTLNNLLIASQ